MPSQSVQAVSAVPSRGRQAESDSNGTTDDANGTGSLGTEIGASVDVSALARWVPSSLTPDETTGDDEFVSSLGNTDRVEIIDGAGRSDAIAAVGESVTFAYDEGDETTVRAIAVAGGTETVVASRSVAF